MSSVEDFLHGERGGWNKQVAGAAGEYCLLVSSETDFDWEILIMFNVKFLQIWCSLGCTNSFGIVLTKTVKS